MRRWLFPLLWALSVPGLQAKEHTPQQPFFPVGKNLHTEVRKAQAEEYSEGLRALNEDSLMTLATDKAVEAYRLTIFRAKGGNLANGGNLEVVKILKKEKSYAITRLTGKRSEKGKPGKLLDSQTADLEASQMKDFAKVFAASSFFDLPTHVDVWGDVGQTIILEAVKDGKYHVAIRWSVPDEPEFLSVYDWIYQHAPKKAAAAK